MDCAYVRLKIARTEGIRGSIIAVMNPHAKNRVVTAAKAAVRSRFVDGIGSTVLNAAFVVVALGAPGLSRGGGKGYRRPAWPTACTTPAVVLKVRPGRPLAPLRR